MSLEEIIKADSVLCNAHARSKKHCLEILSELLVRSIPDTPADDVFESLIDRERLGCTSLNAGVAFPHCRVHGLEQNSAALIKLSEAVDFDCVDGEPVDLIFGLLVPEELEDSDHSDIGTIADILSDMDLRATLRSCNSSNELYKALLAACDAAVPQDLQAVQGS